MKIRGSRAPGSNTNLVLIDGKPLDIEPSRRVYNHSQEPNWGYRGSGPAQLALAILLAGGANQEAAVLSHQQFKEEVIANLRYDFELDVTINPDGSWKVNHLETPLGVNLQLVKLPKSILDLQ